MKRCPWCGREIPRGRRRYCSEACQYGVARANKKLNAAWIQSQLRVRTRHAIKPS